MELQYNSMSEKFFEDNNLQALCATQIENEFNQITSLWSEDKSCTYPPTPKLGSSTLSVNFKKNRYKNVLPVEATRVKLIASDSEDGSDYINANYVSGEIEGS